MSIRRSRGRDHRDDARREQRSRLRWGAGLIVVIAVAVYMIFRGPLPGQGPRELTAVMRDTGAIRANAAIKLRVAGVDVGHVTDVRPMPGRRGMAEVTMELSDPDLVVRRDATLKLRPRLFLEGNFFFDLDPGTPGAPPLGDQPLAPGATSIHVAADEVLSTFDADTRRSFRGAVRGLAGGLRGDGARDFNRVLRALPPALSDSAVVADALGGEADGDLAGLVREAGRTVRAAATRADGIRTALGGGRRTFAAFADRQAELAATIGGLDRLATEATPALRTFGAAVPAARGLLADARPVIERLPRTLDLAAPALRTTRDVTRSGAVQGLLAAFRPAARTVSEVSDPLGGALADLRPVARCVADNVAPVLRATVPDGRHSTGQPVWRDAASLAVGLNSSVASFDQNGYFVRYLLGLGNQLVTTSATAGGEVQGRSELPIQGSSPPKPSSTPPYRPDVPCETQRRVDLETTPRPFRASRRSAPIDPRAVTREARRLLPESGDGAARGGRQAALRRTLGALLGQGEDGR